jgi:hypothetical protein
LEKGSSLNVSATASEVPESINTTNKQPKTRFIGLPYYRKAYFDTKS